MPLEHVWVDEFDGLLEEHAFPQEPQFDVSVLVFVSHVVPSLLQSAVPAAQDRLQLLPEQHWTEDALTPSQVLVPHSVDEFAVFS